MLSEQNLGDFGVADHEPFSGNSGRRNCLSQGKMRNMGSVVRINGRRREGVSPGGSLQRESGFQIGGVGRGERQGNGF